MLKKRSLSIFAYLILSAVVFISLTQGIAFAANRLHQRSLASCSGSGCDGLDPIKTSCADSTTYTVPGGTTYAWVLVSGTLYQAAKIELQYSQTCQTNWSKVTINYPPFSYIPFAQRQTDGVQVIEDVSEIGANPTYSEMLYAPSSPVKACAFATNSSGSFPGPCTPFI